MPRSVTRDDLVERLHAYPHDVYVFIGSINKSIALGTSLVALLPIIDNPTANWLRLGPWCASLMHLLVSHITWSRGILLTNARANLLDVILPVLMGLLEIGLFCVLVSSNYFISSSGHPEKLWRYWLIIAGLHSIVASLLVWNRMRCLKMEEDYAPELLPLAAKYRRWMKSNLIGASFHGGSCLCVGLLWVCSRWSEWRFGVYSYAILALIAGAFLWVPVIQAERERQEIDEFLSTLPQKSGRT